jgi:hypothetical protein
MVWAAQTWTIAGAFREEPRPAVAAHVMKCPQHAVAAAQGEKLPTRDIDREIIAGMLEPRGRAEHLPVALEDSPALRLEYAGVDVVARIEIGEHRHDGGL